jgi:hypothetical protein
MSEFYNQGAVPLNSRAYIPRSFEESVYQEIISNRWVLLLGPRQHGKSTGIVRLKKRFKEAQLIAASVDFQRLPPYENYNELLRHVAEQLVKSIENGRVTPPGAESEGDFLSWLNGIFPLGNTPIVVMVDECATIENSSFRNAFYGQIRQISSQRADAGANDIAARLRFMFSGTFRPETLVHEQNSPFNVCQQVYTDDLTLEQANELATNVHPDVLPFVERAFELVGGQPFLLQTIFLETTRSPDASLEDAFNDTLNELPALVTNHLEGIFSKIIGSSNLVGKVSEMVLTGQTRLFPADSDCTFLQTVGLAKREGMQLVFRNHLYKTVAEESPQLLSEQAAPALDSPIFALESGSLDFMRINDYREVATSAYEGATRAHQNGNYRLALIGYGSALEAVLIDFLMGLPAASRTTAIAAGSASQDPSKRPNFTGREDQNNPETWKLFNLINVVRHVRVGTKAPELSHALRDWRNLVHPAAAVNHYPDESKLKPESVAAAALFAMLTRDIDDLV